MSDLATVGSVVRDSITNCPEVEPFRHDVRLLGDANEAQSSWRHEFWAAYFEPDPGELARFRRVLAAPGTALRDLARLHKARTGTAPLVPEAVIELLRKRLALAYFPSADVVMRRARSGSALYAQQCLTRYIEEDAWRRRS
jgi:hypothetical protein